MVGFAVSSFPSYFDITVCKKVYLYSTNLFRLMFFTQSDLSVYFLLLGFLFVSFGCSKPDLSHLSANSVCKKLGQLYYFVGVTVFQ